AAIDSGAAEPQQRIAVAVADAILHGGTVAEPDVRQPGARSGRGRIGPEIVFRIVPRLRRDQRRAGIAVAELGADHLVALALLDVGDAGESGARRRPRRRVVADIRPIGRAPFPPPERGIARGCDVALADRPALDPV